MTKIPEIDTIQYMGSKTRLLQNICLPIMDDDSVSTIVDLFAGSGSVGFALKNYKTVVSNDLEQYAAIINSAILKGSIFEPKDEIQFFNDVELILSTSTNYLSDLIKREEYLLNESNNLDEYRLFCEQTPYIDDPYSNDESMEPISRLIEQVKQNSKNIPFDCLFITYYANAYFGLKPELDRT